MREPVPAATVVLARRADGADADCRAGIEVLLLKRSAKLVFHGGHWVFPGGRIDAGDYSDGTGDGRLYAAALRAALRETREETGLRIRAEQLIHVGHWTTPPGLPRQFSTWFFVCPLRRPGTVEIDRTEITDHRWLSPRQALRDAREDKLVLPGPTRTTLSDIADYRDLEALERGLRQARVRVFPADSKYYRPAEMGCPDGRG